MPARQRSAETEAVQMGPQAPTGMFFCAECGHVLSTRDEFKIHQETVHHAVNLAESDTDEEDDTAAAPPPRDAAKAPTRTKRTRSRHRSKRGSPSAPTTAKTTGGAKVVIKQRADSSRGVLIKPCLDALSTADVESSSTKGTNSIKQSTEGFSTRQGARSHQGFQGSPAASGAAPTALSATSVHANGLHFDDAVHAAQHAVQELWVPVKKPTPGARGSKVTLLRRPAVLGDAEAAATPMTTTTAAAAVYDTTAAATTAGNAVASAESTGAGMDLVAAAAAGDASLSGSRGDAAAGVPARGRGRTWARARARGRPLTSSRAAANEPAEPSVATAAAAAVTPAAAGAAASTEAAGPSKAGSACDAAGTGAAAVADRAVSSHQTPSRGRGKGRSRRRPSGVSKEQAGVQAPPSDATSSTPAGAEAAAADHRTVYQHSGAAPVALVTPQGKGRGRHRKGRTVAGDGGGVAVPDVRVVWRPKAGQAAGAVTPPDKRGSATGPHGVTGTAHAIASTPAAAAGPCTTAAAAATAAGAGQGHPAGSKASSSGSRRYGRRPPAAAAAAVVDRGSPAVQGATGLRAATAGLAGLAIA